VAIPTDLDINLQAEESNAKTMCSPRSEIAAHVDSPRRALEPDATGVAGDLQPVGDLAAGLAEDPLATLIQHKESDLIEAEFLWNPYLLADEFCTLAGPKGAGKSWITMDIATRVAKATGFPGDENPGAPRSIIYGSREGRTQGEGILGRFVGLGADLSRVCFLPRDWGLDNLPALEAKILASDAALVILDPLQSFFPGSSAYTGPRAREICEALSDLANQTHCCILGILHLTKDHKNARGSGEIENVARVNLQVGQGADGRNLLVHTKSSEARAGVSRYYAICQDGTGVDWQDEAPDEGPEDLARKPSKDRPRELASIFLRTLLADGPKRSKEILLRAESMKLNEKTLRRAAEALGIAQSSQTIYQSGGEWWWKLPDTPNS
jgi:putative DNA primase/helicase